MIYTLNHLRTQFIFKQVCSWDNRWNPLKRMLHLFLALAVTSPVLSSPDYNLTRWLTPSVGSSHHCVRSYSQTSQADKTLRGELLGVLGRLGRLPRRLRSIPQRRPGGSSGLLPGTMVSTTLTRLDNRDGVFISGSECGQHRLRRLQRRHQRAREHRRDHQGGDQRDPWEGDWPRRNIKEI